MFGGDTEDSVFHNLVMVDSSLQRLAHFGFKCIFLPEFNSNWPFHMTGRGGSQIGRVNQPFVMGTSQSGVPAPQYSLDTPTSVPGQGNGE